MRQGLFEVFGEGQLGLKADDLNQYSEVIAESGLIIPEGMVIATGVFEKLSEEFNLNEGVLSEEIEKQGCPGFLLSVNEEILGKLEIGRPYAIRSSALSERGGTGIYKSAFFWPTGKKNEDLKGLWHCECIVYASEFTADARLWRERMNAPIGMAILIQPVTGFPIYDEYFLPALAGTAYTSYQGLLTVRTVIGLGTKAVNGEGRIYNAPSGHILHLQRDMWDQEEADVLNHEGICQVSTHTEEVHGGLYYGFDSFNRLFECVAKMQKHGNFYLEWAIHRDKIFIVQCAPYEDKLPGDLSFDSSKYFTLLQGLDVLHSGRVTCKSVVYVSSWSARTAYLVQMLNEEMKGHLLIIPQDSTSMLANNGGYDSTCGLQNQQLSFAHFSNALAVVEEQHHYSDETRLAMLQCGQALADHSQGRGASHFSQLCGRAEILFIGAEFDERPLLALPGMIKYRGSDHIGIWNTEAEMVVDAAKKSGLVYISKKAAARKNEFPQHLLQRWAYDLRTVANRVNDSGDHEMADHFYNLSYAIGPNTGPLEYDQFELDEEYLALENVGGIEGIKASLRAVLSGGSQHVDPDIWDDGMKDYFEKLLVHLV